MISRCTRRAAAALVLSLCTLAACEDAKKTTPSDGPATTRGSAPPQAKNSDAKAPDAKNPDAKKPDAKAPATSVYKAPQNNQIAGITTPDEVRKAFKEWREAFDETTPDPKAKAALGGVAAGAQITVIFGTWCDDCLREVPQLWRDVEALGPEAPFKLYYVGVDDAFGSGDADLSAYRPDAIPTFVVTRDGREVGRVVERPETTLAADLGRLLAGEASGVLSSSGDLLVSDPARDAPLPTAPASP